MEALGPNETTRKFFGKASTTQQPYGLVLREEPLLRAIPEFDEIGPFGAERSFTRLRSICVPSGPNARKRYSHHLAMNDLQWIVHGGDMLPMGQEQYTGTWLRQFASLPAAPFSDVKPRSTARTQPVTIRQAVIGPRRCLYLVNHSPWTTTTRVELSLPTGTKVTDGFGTPINAIAPAGGKSIWTAEVPPYGMQVAWLGTLNADILDWQVELPPDALKQVKQELGKASRRAQQLQNPAPLRTLANNSFDSPPTPTHPIPAWGSAGRGGIAQVDGTAPKAGKQSLRVTGHANGHIRVTSTAFPTPSTGKCFFFIWMRIPNSQPQPRLKVALRGDNGYYNYFYVGRGPTISIGNGLGQGVYFSVRADSQRCQEPSVRV